MGKKNILFLINPISGTHRKTHLERRIDAQIDLTRFVPEVIYTQYAGHATELAVSASRRGVDAVVAVGGDGTVNEVARALVHTPTALGILPYGSGNGLARHLQIPMHLGKAIALINRYEVRQLDYGTINERPFFCTCGVGFDAFVSFKFATSGKRGWLTYLENALREWVTYKPETYIIEDDEGAHHYKAFLIACANASQYGNNAYIAPQASMEDGLLDVIIMEPFGVIEAPQIAIQLFNRTLNYNSHIKTFRTKRLKIMREHGGEAHCDGEPIMTGAEIDIGIERRGIHMIVNPDMEKRNDNFFVFFTDRLREFSRFHSNLLRKSENFNKTLLEALKRRSPF